MAGSSIISSFQFRSYKVDRVVFDTKHDLEILVELNTIPADTMSFAIMVRPPVYFTGPKFYVGGFDVVLKVLKPSVAEKEENVLLKLELGIAGIFQVEGGRFPAEQEERLVKINIPALLMPYARAAITSLLSTAGFGAVLFPLINVHELAKEQLKDIAIQQID